MLFPMLFPIPLSVPEQWEQNNFNDFKDLTPEKNAVPSVPAIVHHNDGNRIISGVEEPKNAVPDAVPDAVFASRTWEHDNLTRLSRT